MLISRALCHFEIAAKLKLQSCIQKSLTEVTASMFHSSLPFSHSSYNRKGDLLHTFIHLYTVGPKGGTRMTYVVSPSLGL